METKEPTYPFYARREYTASAVFKGTIARFDNSDNHGICVKENDYDAEVLKYRKGDDVVLYNERDWQILDKEETEKLLREITEFPFYVKDTNSEMIVKFISKNLGEIIVEDKATYPYSYNLGEKRDNFVSCFDAEEWTPLTKDQIKGFETPLESPAVESELQNKKEIKGDKSPSDPLYKTENKKEMNNKNTDRYWAALAREGKTMDIPDGYVYIGKGDSDISFCDYMEVAGSLENKLIKGNNHIGNCDYLDYVATIEEWEKATGLSYAEIINPSETKAEKPEVLGGLPPSFYILVSNPEYSAAVQRKLFGLGYDWVFEDKKIRNTNFPVLRVDSNNITWDNEAVKYPSYFGEEITMGQLFSNNYAPVFKPIKFEFKGYDGVITKNSLKVGCQEISLEKLEVLKRIVDQYSSDCANNGIDMILTGLMNSGETDIILTKDSLCIETANTEVEMTFGEFLELNLQVTKGIK